MANCFSFVCLQRQTCCKTGKNIGNQWTQHERLHSLSCCTGTCLLVICCRPAPGLIAASCPSFHALSHDSSQTCDVSAKIDLPTQIHVSAVIVIFLSDSRLCSYFLSCQNLHPLITCRIPFGDHPIKLERYRED